MLEIPALFEDEFHFFNCKDIWQPLLFSGPVQVVELLLSAQYLFVVEFDSADSLILLRRGYAFVTNQLEDIIIDLLTCD